MASNYNIRIEYSIEYKECISKGVLHVWRKPLPDLKEN